MNIFLIGYRCSGKTAVGKSLAVKTGRLFIDSDDEIVKEHGLSIKVIVHNQGWSAFRKSERMIIKKLGAQDQLVVATGGGAVLDPENVAEMKKTGTLVWLKAEAGTIKKRMVHDDRTGALRPSLTTKGLLEEIEEMLRIRKPSYETAMNFFVDTDNRSVADICDLIIKKLDRY